MEEDFWKLRSRVNWLNEEEKNSKFFHICATNNRRINKIVFFKDLEGNWIDDPLKIMEHTLSYFEQVFTTSHCYSNWSSIKTDPLSYKDFSLSSLDNPISPSNIKNALFSFKTFKYPGPDGLHSFFFQKY